MTPDRIPATWCDHLRDAIDSPSFQGLCGFVAEERRRATLYPAEADVFAALALTAFEDVRAVILGQDPYHGPGQAHGLAFSVRPGVRPPPSLANIYRELHADLGCPVPRHGSLVAWAQRGVLLLNAVLTVRDGEPNSHRGRGWEEFTDAVLRAVNARATPAVFLLWGSYAQKKASLIDAHKHVVLQSAHPSPLSAHRGFLGSRPFSAANRALEQLGQAPIDWCLP